MATSRVVVVNDRMTAHDLLNCAASARDHGRAFLAHGLRKLAADVLAFDGATAETAPEACTVCGAFRVLALEHLRLCALCGEPRA